MLTKSHEILHQYYLVLRFTPLLHFDIYLEASVRLHACGSSYAELDDSSLYTVSQ